MEDSLFGAKEFYDVVLRATTKTIVNGREYLENEPLVKFGRLQIAQLSGSYRYISARGGFDNRELVTWEDMKSISLSFQQGVFSKTQFSYFINGQMIEKVESDKILVPQNQILEAQEDGTIQLPYEPERLFVYDIQGGKITDYEVVGATISGLAPYTNYICDYAYKYKDSAVYFQMGKQITNNYVCLEGKTRLKDDNTGKIVTGLITIPRLKLKTGISIRLGADAEPITGVFYGDGYPIGTRGNKTVCSLTMLSDDIDSDF